MFKFLVLSIFLVTCANSARILTIFNAPTFSHHTLATRLIEELAAKGHEVTYITPFNNDQSAKNYTVIHLDDLIGKFLHATKEINFMEVIQKNMYLYYKYLRIMTYQIVSILFENKNVQNLLADKEKQFDVVIIDQFFNDGLKIFCHHYNAHCIMYSTCTANDDSYKLVGNPSSYAYVPETFLDYSYDMNAIERLNNLMYQNFVRLMNYWYYDPQQNELLQKYFLNPPTIAELRQNISLVLVNTHFSFNQPIPLAPNIIEIGGHHIKPPKQLPHDLKTLMDNANDGVVYVSFGSFVNGKDMPLKKQMALISAFSKLKQKVLWKFEMNATSLPENVVVSKWFPQSDILAHNNTKLFITHGGSLSISEGVHYGVPLIGVPLFGDQKMNMAQAERNGFALKLSYSDLNEKQLTEAINKILNNKSKLVKTIKERSSMLRDRQTSASDNAIYWIEYIIRHKGAQHLRVYGNYMPWYSLYMLDSILLLVGGLFGILLSIYIFFTKISFPRQNIFHKMKYD